MTDTTTQSTPDDRPSPPTLDEAWRRMNRPADQLKGLCRELMAYAAAGEYDQGDVVTVPYDSLVDVVEALRAALSFAARPTPRRLPMPDLTPTDPEKLRALAEAAEKWLGHWKCTQYRSSTCRAEDRRIPAWCNHCVAAAVLDALQEAQDDSRTVVGVCGECGGDLYTTTPLNPLLFDHDCPPELVAWRKRALAAERTVREQRERAERAEAVRDDYRTRHGEQAATIRRMITESHAAERTIREQRERSHPKGRDCARTDEVLENYRRRAIAAERTIREQREALRWIAEYDPRWTGQHVNDAPSRAQIIARAFDALAALAPDTEEEGS